MIVTTSIREVRSKRWVVEVEDSLHASFRWRIVCGDKKTKWLGYSDIGYCEGMATASAFHLGGGDEFKIMTIGQLARRLWTGPIVTR